MAATHAMQFGGAQLAWKWEGVDDSGFISYLNANGAPTAGDYVIDRSGLDVELQWQIYQYVYPTGYLPTGNYDSIVLTSGDLITVSVGNHPAIAGASTWWESNEHGKPLDVNDLQA